MGCSILRIGFLVTVVLAGSVPMQGRTESRRIELQPTRIYTNGPSQFRFPPTVATFQRESTFEQYDTEGRDIGVGYNDLLHSVAATVFVYPSAKRPPNDKLEGHFGTCKAEVLNRHAGAKLLSEGKVQVSTGGRRQDGVHASFTCTDVFAHQRQSVRSELYLFMQGHTFILFRITYPAGLQAAAEPAVKAFVDGFTWP